MTSEAGRGGVGRSIPPATTPVGVWQRMVPAVVLVVAALRIVVAMTFPPARDPGWLDIGTLIIAVGAACFLLATQRVSIPRLCAAIALGSFWLSPWISSFIHGEPAPTATIAMAAVAVVLVLAPPRATALVRTAVVVGATIVILSLAYGVATAAGLVDGAFHSVGDYERTTFGVSALRGITLHPNTLGPIAAATLLLALLLPSVKVRWVTWLIPALCVVALLWSQSRAAVAGTILAVLALVVVATQDRLRAAVVALALLIPIGPFVLFTPIAESLPIEELFNKLFTGRQVPWAVAEWLFRGSPVTGYGTDAFSNAFWDQGPSQWWHPLHAHNEILEAASQSGLVGLAALSAVALTAAITTLSRPKGSAHLAVALLVLVCVQAAVEVPMGLTYFPISYLFPMLVVAGMAFQGEVGWPRPTVAEPVSARPPRTRDQLHSPEITDD